ncbi:hypothetical protein [Dinghuibacter silviterrae]|uniref:Uncharacterized protein n=1 Tax=Dinghuibacter silviterrae TaxID=1539049 RepID=A0A4R8DGX6_9BACT|nr:hypothetical protein [Dinghuibacter silviterrae]TDW96933.1 hypothetical protein EDB95_4769 [Dinghuibacter silviterrae]
MTPSARWLLTVACIALPVLMVYCLYTGTYQPNKEDNGFNRTWAGWVAAPEDTIRADFRYGEICGVTPSGFFVEMPGHKNQVARFGWSLGAAHVSGFALPNNPHIWSRVHCQVDSPYIYLFAGNGPDVFKGRLDTPAQLLQHHYPYPTFIKGIALTGGEYLIRGYDKDSGAYHLPFILWDPATNRQVRKTDPFHSAAAFGLAADGTMHYDTATKRLVFVQFYRNGILMLDTDFSVTRFLPTIDTVAHGRTADGSYQENGTVKYTNSTPQFFVNWNTAVSDGLLFINSLLRADNEPKGTFEDASDIDVYDLSGGGYRYSLKVPRLDGRKLVSFAVRGRAMVVCYPGGLVTYRLVNGAPPPATP